jgi:AcrR family transcriptional regulator
MGEMARPKSEEKRNAILEAATRIIASQGLGASTASIAAESGVSNGSIFTYFATKSELLNQLYVELKDEVGAVALNGVAENKCARDQVRHAWTNWLKWATSNPDKRRTLAQLSVSDEITMESKQIGRRSFEGMGELLELSRADGPMAKAPMTLVVALMNGLAEATMDLMTQDPKNAADHSAAAFDAMWRMLH